MTRRIPTYHSKMSPLEQVVFDICLSECSLLELWSVDYWYEINILSVGNLKIVRVSTDLPSLGACSYLIVGNSWNEVVDSIKYKLTNNNKEHLNGSCYD